MILLVMLSWKKIRLLAEKPVHEAFMTESKSRRAQGSRCNKGKGPQGKGGSEASYNGQKCRKRVGKKSKNKNCFNCGKLGYFARNCTESKVVFDHNSPSNIYVSSCLTFAENVHFWIVDTTAIDHIARDRTFVVEFR